MTRDCYQIEDLSELADLDPDHPRLAHAKGCSRCRSLLTEIREFRGPRRVPEGADPDAADDHLASVLDSELRRSRDTLDTESSAQAPLAYEPTGLWARIRKELMTPAFRPVWGLAVAAAIVIVFIQITGESAEEALRVVRDAAPIEIEAPSLLPPSRLDSGSIRLVWHKMTGADSYQVLLHNLNLDELARLDTGPDTLLVLTEELFEPIPLPADRQVLWQVVALRRGDRIGISRPGTLQLP